MKPGFTAIALFFVLATTSRAQVVNPGFEQWDTVTTHTYAQELIDSFGVASPMMGAASGWKESSYYGLCRVTAAQSHSGNQAAIVHNWYTYVNETLMQRIAVSQNPTSLTGFFKYNASQLPAGPSTGSCTVTVKSTTGDNIGNGDFTFNNTPTWTAFTIPINYGIPGVADSVIIEFSSATTPCPPPFGACNLLWLDELDLDSSPLSFWSADIRQALFTVSPNPGRGAFVITGRTSGTFDIHLYSAEGRCIHAQSSTDNTASIDLSGQAAGIYFYMIQEKGIPVQTGKLILE